MKTADAVKKTNIVKPEAYFAAYTHAHKHHDFADMTCSRCDGVLKITPFIKNAYYKKNGVLSYELDTFNYCKVCWQK